MILALFFILVQETIHCDQVNPLPQLQVHRDLVLGGSKASEEQIFSMTIALAAAPDGTIFVTDPTAFLVSAFDSTGKFLHSFGRQGAGPGEFQEPVGIALDPDGNVAIFDTGSKKFCLFRPDGTFLRESPIMPGLQGILKVAFLPNGNIALAGYKTGEGFQIAFDLALYDREMKLISQLENVPTPKIDWEKVGEPGFWANMMIGQFETVARGMPVFTVAGERLVGGLTREYRGLITDSGGLPLARFTKAFKPVVFSEELKIATCEAVWLNLAANPALTNVLTRAVFEQAVRKAEMPARVAPIAGMVSLEKGFAVLSNYNLLQQKGQLDFFDLDGTCSGSGNYQGVAGYLVGVGNRLYAIGQNENGDMIIERHQVSGLK